MKLSEYLKTRTYTQAAAEIGVHRQCVYHWDHRITKPTGLYAKRLEEMGIELD